MTTQDLTLSLPVDELRQTLKENGVLSASVFGSYARGEQAPGSDLDLFVTFNKGTGLFKVFDVQTVLENRLGIKVDLVTKINKNFLPYIEPDLIDLNV